MNQGSWQEEIHGAVTGAIPGVPDPLPVPPLSQDPDDVAEPVGGGHPVVLGPAESLCRVSTLNGLDDAVMLRDRTGLLTVVPAGIDPAVPVRLGLGSRVERL